MAADRATLLHLSDLHLGENLDDAGSPQKALVRSALKLTPRAQSHDLYILTTLPNAIRQAARIIGARDDRFDIHVLTGDLSTAANSAARFEFARRFITGTLPWKKGLFLGLQLSRESILCVPGNHDKLWQLTPELYLASFRDLPSELPYRVDRVARNGRRFIFFGVDSNLYEEGNVALGRISPDTLAWLEGRLSECAREADRATGAVRILLLHHHPCDLNPYRRLRYQLWRRAFWNKLTRLEEGERLLTLCKGSIDVIMHGHEHFPIAFRDKVSGCLVISAGTVSEYHSKFGQNSFHAISVEGAEIRVVQFDWNGARFAREAEWIYEMEAQRFWTECT